MVSCAVVFSETGLCVFSEIPHPAVSVVTMVTPISVITIVAVLVITVVTPVMLFRAF